MPPKNFLSEIDHLERQYDGPIPIALRRVAEQGGMVNHWQRMICHRRRQVSAHCVMTDRLFHEWGAMLTAAVLAKRQSSQ